MDIRKFFTQRVSFELEWAPQGSGHSTNLNSRRIWTVLSVTGWGALGRARS